MGEAVASTEPTSRQSFIEDARRTQIVGAAIEVIADVGYNNATFVRIAERAGISPALISYHFGSKDHLMAQVSEHVSASIDEAIERAVEGAPSYREALRRMIETFVRYFGHHPAETTAMGEIQRQELIGDGTEGRASERAQWVDELETMFREGQAEGEWWGFNPRAMAVTLLASMQATPAELHGRSVSEVDAYATDLADLFDAATRKRRGRR